MTNGGDKIHHAEDRKQTSTVAGKSTDKPDDKQQDAAVRAEQKPPEQSSAQIEAGRG